MEQKNSADLTAPAPDDYHIGQKVIVAKRGPATVVTRVLPDIWAVEFIGLEGFGYVFADEMRPFAGSERQAPTAPTGPVMEPLRKTIAA